MQVAIATRTLPALRAPIAQFFLSSEHQQDDLALGHAYLSTARAQCAFRAAGVDQVWLIGRAPEIQPGKIPSRVVGILSSEEKSALLFEHIEGLERVLRSVCGTPVKVHCFFRASAVPASALPVAARAAGARPELPIPAALTTFMRQASANDSRVEVSAEDGRARPPLPRAAGLHH